MTIFIIPVNTNISCFLTDTQTVKMMTQTAKMSLQWLDKQLYKLFMRCTIWSCRLRQYHGQQEMILIHLKSSS